MKRKFLVALCSAICAVTCAAGLSACVNPSDKSNDEGGKIYDGAFTVQAAYEQANDLGYIGTLDDFIVLISGKDGKDGANGVGISTVFLDSGGELIVVLTDGTVQRLGKINGKDGVDGKDGANGKDGVDGKDGANGKDGADGKDGVDGKDGQDGVGIVSVSINANGELFVVYTDGRTENLGKLPSGSSAVCTHTYSGWRAGFSATCTSMGYNTRTCTQCGVVDYEFIQVLGHRWNGGMQVKEPDCKNEGLTLYTCSICNTVKGESIPTVGHSYDQNGACSVCGEQSSVFNFRLNANGAGYIVSLKEEYRTTVESIVIPSGYNGLPVTEIATNAIIKCTKLKSITLPETILKIGKTAFAFNTSLEYVNIPKSVVEIGARPFYSDQNVQVDLDSKNTLFKITGNCLIDKVNKVLICGFENCSLPNDNSYNKIGEFAFFKNYSLTSVVIPDFVTVISIAAFSHCDNLESVIFGDDIASVEKGAFSFCSDLQTVVINKNIASIGAGCFSSLYASFDLYFEGTEDEWNEISIGSGIWINKVTIYFYSETQPEAEGNFWHYVNGNITIYRQLEIDEILTFNLFNNSTEYKVSARNKSYSGEITIPSTYNGLPVTEIADNAFLSCTNLTGIIIPNGVVRISNNAFAFSGLKNITIPQSIEKIGNNCFRNCSSLESFTVEEGNSVYCSSGNCLIEIQSKTLLYGCKNSVIPYDGSVTTIAKYAFTKCYGLKNLIIPDSVTFIEDSAFLTCYDIETVVIGTGVTELVSIFNSCQSVESITINGNLKYLGNVYVGCSNLKEIYYNGTKEQWSEIEKSVGWDNLKGITIHCLDGIWELQNEFTFSLSEDGTYYSLRSVGGLTNSHITVPSQYKGLPVKKIGDSAFSGCSFIESVVLPEGLIRIGNFSFQNCSNLVSINFPESLKQIATDAFSGCINLAEINLPDNIESFGAYPFNNTAYYNDESNWIGGALYINNYLLNVNPNVEDGFEILHGTKVIATYAFNDCKNITCISIPDSVTRLNCAFLNCVNLKEVVLSATIIEVDNFTFYYNGVTTITYLGTVEQWSNVKKIIITSYASKTYTIVCLDGILENEKI